MKKNTEEQMDFSIDNEAINSAQQMAPQPVVVPQQEEEERPIVRRKVQEVVKEPELINCLQNRKITVRHIPRQGAIEDKSHVLYGGLSERSVVILTVPVLRTGAFKNVLTKAEKDFLEYELGLEVGALNVYNKKDNFWDNGTEGGINTVRLGKRDTILDLSKPEDYIRYKILLANTDIVAPDIYTLQDRPKATYQFVLIAEDETNAAAKTKMNYKMQCYTEYSKIATKEDILKSIIETMTSKPIARTTKLEFLQTRIGELIDSDSKTFYKIITDPLLATRVLIKKATEQGLISKKGDFYYLRSDNSPLCEGGEDPTLTMAAKYLSDPRRQTIKLSLEAQIK